MQEFSLVLDSELGDMEVRSSGAAAPFGCGLIRVFPASASPGETSTSSFCITDFDSCVEIQNIFNKLVRGESGTDATEGVEK